MRRFSLLAAIALFLLPATSARAAGEERAAVQKGVQFLKSQISTMNPGFAGVSALAMIKADVPLNDPGLSACLAQFASTFTGTTYTPATKGGPDIYEASVVLLALVNIDPIAYKPQIDAVSQ